MLGLILPIADPTPHSYDDAQAQAVRLTCACGTVADVTGSALDRPERWQCAKCRAKRHDGK